MSSFDLIILAVLLGFTLFGFFSGFLQAAGSILGAVAGIFFAQHYFETLGNWIVAHSDWSPNTARIVAFLLLFAVTTRAIGVFVWLAEKVLHVLPIPFSRLFNKLLGAFLGFGEGLIVLGLFVYLLKHFPIAGAWGDMIKNSLVIDRAEPILSRIVSYTPDVIINLLGWL